LEHWKFMKSTFDYEKKLFGVGRVKKALWHIPSIKLVYCLQALKNVHGKVLEIGCGAGAMSKAIKYYRPNLEVYGTDISHAAIAVAKKDPGNVDFRIADIYNMPFKDNYFESVVCFDVLEHLPDIPRASVEVRRILKKGGLFHSVTPCEGNLWIPEGWITGLGWKAKEIYCGHINHFTFDDLEKKVLVKGFSFVKHQTSAHLISQLADIMYFTWLSLRGNNVLYQVEGYIASERGWKRNIIFLIRSMFAVLSNIESYLLFWYPGLNNHLTVRKDNRV